MLKYFVFIFNLTTFFVELCGTQLESNTSLKLIISPSGHIVEQGPPILVQRVEDSLNLTCRLIKENDKKLPNYNISWNWQYSQKNNANRVMMVSLAHNEANLVFKSLKETDSGEYTCKCPELNLFENIWIKVKPFKRSCSEKMFVCSTGNCIGRNYVCDGKEDCKYGTDEDPEYCGLNPCQGKIPCDNGRCIPTSWCCDEDHDPNCTTKHKPKCCQQLVRSFSDIDSADYSQHPFGDMGFLQTTIYTVIGCAMAFMLIVTVLVIAICRVHLKRTVISRCPLNHQHHPGSQIPSGLPLYDIDMFLDRQQDHAGGLLVTYNINNGVQFVGRPVDPPPYCEIIDTPPREGPPPPYVSRENVSEIVEIPGIQGISETTCMSGASVISGNTGISGNSENTQINEQVASCSHNAEKLGDATISSINDVSHNLNVLTTLNQIQTTKKRFKNNLVNNSTIENCQTNNTLSCNNINKVIAASSLGELSKIIPENSVINSYEICSSVPSVSGLNNKIKNKNIKRNILQEFSDSDTDSSYMENDNLLVTNQKHEEHDNKETSSNSFINNIAAVSKSLIGSFKKSNNDINISQELKNSQKNIRSNTRKQLRPLLTQKSFDSSDRTRKELILNGANFSKIVPNVTHSMGDLSPVNTDLSYNDFNERGLTLPLRESHIGVRNENEN